MPDSHAAASATPDLSTVNQIPTPFRNKKFSWCWQTRATRLQVSQGQQTYSTIPYAIGTVSY